MAEDERSSFDVLLSSPVTTHALRTFLHTQLEGPEQLAELVCALVKNQGPLGQDACVLLSASAHVVWFALDDVDVLDCLPALSLLLAQPGMGDALVVVLLCGSESEVPAEVLLGSPMHRQHVLMSLLRLSSHPMAAAAGWSQVESRRWEFAPTSEHVLLERAALLRRASAHAGVDARLVVEVMLAQLPSWTGTYAQLVDAAVASATST